MQAELKFKESVLEGIIQKTTDFIKDLNDYLEQLKKAHFIYKSNTDENASRYISERMHKIRQIIEKESATLVKCRDALKGHIGTYSEVVTDLNKEE